jgi:hypothetical protein
LFTARKYRDSLDLFTDISAPPEQVVKLYPPSIAGDLSTIDDNGSSDMVEEPTEMESQKDVDGIGSPSGSIRRSQATERSSKSTLPAGLRGLATKNLSSDAASNASATPARKPTPPAPASDNGSISDRQSIVPLAPDSPLSGDDLHAAVSALCSFLADARRRLQRYLAPDGTLRETLDMSSPSLDLLLLLSPSTRPSEPDSPLDIQSLHDRLLQTAKLVDTTLFKSYTLTRPSLASSLFRISNFCDPDVVNDALLASHRYAELVDFLHGKKLHRQALELLRKHGQGEGEASEQLRGTRRTIAYLQSLGPADIDLTLDFAAWVLHDAGDEGLEIFTADTENAEMLPRDRVATFLREADEGGKHGWERKYLEHVVNEWDDLTPSFHMRLVTIYVESLRHHPREDGEASETKQARAEKLVSFLKSSNHYSTAKALNLIPRDGKLMPILPLTLPRPSHRLLTH